MTTKLTTLLVAALLGLGLTANAVAVTVYTDRALFEAALATSTIETFEFYPTYGDPNSPPDNPSGLTSLALDDFSLTADPKAIKIWNAEHEGSHNTTLFGSKFLYLDTDIGYQGSTTHFQLYSPVDAFGFDYTGVFGHGTTFKVTIGSDPFEFELNPNDENNLSSHLFWGVIGTTSFEKITLITDFDGGYGVDEVTLGSAIPLPPALWLFGSGLLALAGSGIRRKIHS